jgi:plasmid stability protein
MKNVTISLPDDFARRARVAAAGQHRSLSRFVADLLKECCKSEKSDKPAGCASSLSPESARPGPDWELLADPGPLPILRAGLRPAVVRGAGRYHYVFGRGHATSTWIEGMTILNPFKLDPDVAFAQ